MLQKELAKRLKARYDTKMDGNGWLEAVSYTHLLIYGRINLIALPFYVLQYEFQCLFATAEKPRLGLSVTCLLYTSRAP